MKKTLISLIIGIILLGVIFYTLGITEVVSLISHTNLYLFVLAIIPFLVMEFTLGCKLKLLVPELSIKKTFLSHQGGMFLSNLTPGRAGYYYAAYSLAKKTNTSISGKVGLVTLIQGITMITKIIILVIAFIYLSFIIEIPLIFLVAFTVPAAVVILTFFVLYTETSHAILKKIPVLNKATKYLELMQDGVKHIKTSHITKLFSIDVACWVLSGIQFYILALALGINIDPVMSILFVQLISVLMFVPISPAGLGLTEGGGVVLFILLGFTAPQAISLILLWRLHSILVDGVIGMWDINLHQLKWSPVAKNELDYQT